MSKINVDEATIERRKALGNFNDNATQNPDWTLEEKNILRELYPENSTEDLMLFLNRSKTAILHKASRMGLRKSEKFMAGPESGRFQPKPEKKSKLKRMFDFIGWLFKDPPQ